MSNKKQTLDVFPPLFNDHLNGEHFSFDGFDCPTCAGWGSVPIHSDYLGIAPDDTELCQRCHGATKLRADVVIRWMPDE